MDILRHRTLLWRSERRSGNFLYAKPSQSMCLNSLIFLFVLGCLNVQEVYGYNMDLETATAHSGETGSMFGFAVALHQDQGSKWLLIGAPRAQTSQPGVIRGGAVYRCPTDTTGYCQAIPFDNKGNDIHHNGSHYLDVEDKSNQWFGATVKSSENGIIVACAPRYVYFSQRLDKREPVGTCFVARSSSTDYEEYSPCRTRVDVLPLVTDQFHQQGYCQAGFSAALTYQGRQLLIGAVGSWYWQGQLFNFNFEDGPGRYKATPEGRQKDDYSLMGYSSAVGKFDDDDLEDYVVGVPKGEELKGKVVLYDQNLTIIQTIYGEQFGAFFGYAVEVEDLDGNGLDDIIIGAPLYTDYNSDDSAYETGRVHIYYQNKNRRFRRRAKDVLDGHHSRSRFGLSLAGLGDIDYDGYNDLAVGAPYGGEDGRGVVYIYHGSMKGIITDIQQEIKAQDVLSGIQTFGWSLSGRVDMDDNLYPDLLVGAYDSNKAIFLKSRPVVRVTPSVSIDPVNITLEDKNCELVSGEKVTCLTVYTCMVYTGVGVPDELNFVLTWNLDAKMNDSSRVFYVETESTRKRMDIVKVYKNKNYCKTAFTYLVNNIRDKLTAVEIDFSFKLHEKNRRQRRDVSPVLNMRIPTVAKAEANILKECGVDNVCIPDLAVTAVQLSDAHVLGRTDKLEVLIMIDNRGEDSYESTLTIMMPKGIQFSQKKDEKSEIPISCDVLGDEENRIFCDLGNPFPKESQASFILEVTPKQVSDLPELVFRMTANSSNAENISDVDNNIAIVTIPVKQLAELQISGKSEPEQVSYTASDVKLYRETTQVGPLLEFVFHINNRPESSGTIKESLLEIELPGEDSAGLSILQVEKEDIIPSNNNIMCHVSNHTVTYQDQNGDVSVVLSQKAKFLASNTSPVRSERKKRDVTKRSPLEIPRLGCFDGSVERRCLYIRCKIGNLELGQTVNVTVKSQIFTSTLIKKKYKELGIVARARAKVVKMPFPDLEVDTRTMSEAVVEVETYVNAVRLFPQSDGIEPWIIGVAVSAGFLLLLLLIVLLWWCGFFQRKRPDDPAYKTPQNGDYKRVDGGPPPDQRYQYM